MTAAKKKTRKLGWSRDQLVLRPSQVTILMGRVHYGCNSRSLCVWFYLEHGGFKESNSCSKQQRFSTLPPLCCVLKPTIPAPNIGDTEQALQKRLHNVDA